MGEISSYFLCRWSEKKVFFFDFFFRRKVQTVTFMMHLNSQLYCRSPSDWRWIKFHLISPEMIERLVKHHWIETRYFQWKQKKKRFHAVHTCQTDEQLSYVDSKLNTKDSHWLRHCYCKKKTRCGSQRCSIEINEESHLVKLLSHVSRCILCIRNISSLFISFLLSSSLWLIAITYVFCWPFA